MPSIVKNAIGSQSTGGGTGRGKNARRRKLRNAAMVVGTTGALVVGGSGVAQAQDSVVLEAGQSATFSTWFWGKTQLCFTNLNANNTAGVRYSSGFSMWDVSVAPRTQKCVVHSFVGLPVRVLNLSYNGAAIEVSLPIGP